MLDAPRTTRNALPVGSARISPPIWGAAAMVPLIKSSKCRVEEFIATVADCIRNESGLIDCRIKVPPQRHLLYGKPSRDEAGGELLHDACGR